MAQFPKAALITAAALLAGCPSYADDPDCQLVEEGHGPEGTVALSVEEVAGDLEIPWAIDWLPDGSMLVTERGGDLIRIEDGGRGARTTLATIIESADGEGGLLGMAVHPEVATNRFVYVYFTTGESPNSNRVERWVLSEDYASISLDRPIIEDIPARQYHNGGRIRFGPDGHLYVGTGDASTPADAQDTDSLAGKLLRVADDGSIPAGNPFEGSATWVYGVRNTQGFDWWPDGSIALTDHGPSGLAQENLRENHDEVYIVAPGDNLGWPTIFKCQTTDGMRAPAITWAEALPPGGTAIYQGGEIPEFEGDVFIGVLGFGDDIGHLHRIRFDADGRVEISERYLAGTHGRLREVIMGPDGGLYVTTSACDGRGTCPEGGDKILRLGAPTR